MEVPSGNGWLKRPLSHDPIGGEVIPAPAVSLAVRSQGLELRHRRRFHDLTSCILWAQFFLVIVT